MECFRYLIWVCVLAFASIVGAEDPVLFGDAKLKAAVEEALLTFDPTPSEMLELIDFRFTNQGLSDITGLEYAKNLQSLNLYWNHIVDISPISTLVQLEYLHLGRNEIDDFSALSDLVQVYYLNLHENNITDISDLSALVNMDELIIRQNQISDLSPLSGMTQLRELMVQRNQVSDLSPLSGLTNLVALQTYVNQIDDISPLSSLARLQELYIYENQITDLSPLGDLTELRTLYAQDNLIYDLWPLTNLVNLQALDVEFNPLEEAEYCLSLPKIQDKNPGISFYYDPHIAAPRHVQATDGTFLKSIHVTWSPVCNGPKYTSYYQVSRALQNDPNQNVLGAWQTDTHMDDFAVQPDQTYQYRVRVAVSHAGIEAGPFSQPDLGWLADGPEPDSTTGTPTRLSDLAILHVDDELANDPQADGTREHPFDSIQEAIHVAPTGAIILVHEGIYYETLCFTGRHITVTSFDPNGEQGFTYPIVDANDQGTVVFFGQGEDSRCRLSGLVLTGGLGEQAGAIECRDSSPTIDHCLVLGNQCLQPTPAQQSIL